MCNCIKEVNKKLDKHNTVLTVPFLLDGGVDRVIIDTCKANSNVRKKPIRVFASYCPFCGEKYEVNHA